MSGPVAAALIPPPPACVVNALVCALVAPTDKLTTITVTGRRLRSSFILCASQSEPPICAKGQAALRCSATDKSANTAMRTSYITVVAAR